MLRSAFLLPLFLISTFIALSSCRQDTRTPVGVGEAKILPDTIRQEEVPTEGAVTYKVVEGTIFWSGQPAVGSAHNGIIRLSEGELLVNRGRLLSGTITIDMNTIAVTDIADGGERRDLEGHLKHADFFEVVKYPTGVFKFDEVLPSNLPEFNGVIAGELTLKGKTNPVNVPVKMTINADELIAESPSFHINRTQWGINFHSGVLGTAKDKLIQDMIILSLKLKAQKSP
ncbi:MAG: YceI family protein [Saprospiraceae bacterium]